MFQSSKVILGIDYLIAASHLVEWELTADCAAGRVTDDVVRCIARPSLTSCMPAPVSFTYVGQAMLSGNAESPCLVTASVPIALVSDCVCLRCCLQSFCTSHRTTSPRLLHGMKPSLLALRREEHYLSKVNFSVCCAGPC